MRYSELFIQEEMMRRYENLCSHISITKSRDRVNGECQYKRLFESKVIYQDSVLEIYDESTIVVVYFIQQITLQMKIYCNIYVANLIFRGIVGVSVS